MNHFDNLPLELQEKIYLEEHKMMMGEALFDIVDLHYRFDIELLGILKQRQTKRERPEGPVCKWSMLPISKCPCCEFHEDWHTRCFGL